MMDQFRALSQTLQMAFLAVAAVAVIGVVASIALYNAKQSDAAAWAAERADLGQRIEGLEGDKAALEENKAALESQVAEQTAAIGALQTDKAELTKFHGSLAALQAETAASRDKLASLSTAIGQNENRLKVVGHQLAVGQASLLSVVRKREAAQRDAASLRANQARLAALSEEVYAQERRLGELGQRLATGQASLKTLTLRRREAGAEVERLRAAAAGLEPVIAEVAAKALELRGLAQRAAAADLRLTQTLNRQRQAREDLDGLRVQGNYLAGVVADLEVKERRLAELGRRLASAQSSYEKALRRRQLVIDDSQAMQAKLANAERKLVPLQNALAAWEAEVQDLRDLVGEAQGALGAPLIN